LVVIGRPFIEVKPFDTLHIDYFNPHIQKSYDIFSSNKQVKQCLYKPGRGPRVTGNWAS